MAEPFRDETHAALERVAQLERENAELQTRLAQRLSPPLEARAMPGWLIILFVLVPILLMGAGLAVAFFLRPHAALVR